MNIKQWLRNWLLDGGPRVDNANWPSKPSLATKSSPQDHIEQEAAQLTFAVIKATNGYIVKASQYKPQQRGPDWIHQLYIVKDDEKIPDVIARIMAINALEN